jgi:hypothetical protein
LKKTSKDQIRHGLLQCKAIGLANSAALPGWRRFSGA